MRIELPGWVTDNRTSVRREVADYRDLQPEERLEILHRVCRDAAAFAYGSPDRERILMFRDRLPRSSIDALERLRKQLRAGR
jgi:hypothetical protein